MAVPALHEVQSKFKVAIADDGINDEMVPNTRDNTRYVPARLRRSAFDLLSQMANVLQRNYDCYNISDRLYHQIDSSTP